MTSDPTAPALSINEAVKLSQKIRDANPDKQWFTRQCDVCGKFMSLIEDCTCEPATVSVTVEPIRLGDVLLAMQNKTGKVEAVGVTINGDLLDCNPDMTEWYIRDANWDLRHDSLDDQSASCKRFLFDIICQP